MTNETFVPMGLVELTKQVADSARANIKSKRKQVDDLEDRLHSALDAKRDVASDYSRQLQERITQNNAMWKSGYDVGHDEGHNAGYDEGHSVGYDQGYKLGLALAEPQASEKRDRDLLESHRIDVDGFCDRMARMIEDHEPDKDEDEPDQYQPEAEKWGGTK